jgi:Mn-containing catalase
VAILAGMNSQHATVTGMRAAPTDSQDYPYNSRYTIASGNLLADFRYKSPPSRRAAFRWPAFTS